MLDVAAQRERIAQMKEHGIPLRQRARIPAL
jgi:hypothetical protein